MGNPKAGRSKCIACQHRAHHHIIAGVLVAVTAVNCRTQGVCNQFYSLACQRIGNRFRTAGCVSLNCMGQCIHPRCRSNTCRKGVGQFRVTDRKRRHDPGTADRHLPFSLPVCNHRKRRTLASSPRRSRNGYNGQRCGLEFVTPLIIPDTAAIRNNNCGCLGGIHRTPAAKANYDICFFA